jgi:hypothetical protein
VATDLFCGVLAAVIILDAVAPKEQASAGSEVLLTLTYKNAPRQASEPLNNCRVGNVVFHFRDASADHSTLGSATTASLVTGECRVEAFLPDVNVQEGFSDTILVVAQYAGDLTEAVVSMTGLPSEIKCRKDGTTECRIL